ncbi:hypothetical protein PN450_08560 [Dolichospermum lemmermannii CS-548]|uniref:hypothetical protein n=1 Tax=Dolichospermum lemmermannii TaxID=54295 RepID=UPI00232FA8AB|nr:hypothetical protein [Dolichospermum lemmermannii]MDB9436855.1 hypothetical protein [Dolichospermum lemmermannii CS-548]
MINARPPRFGFLTSKIGVHVGVLDNDRGKVLELVTLDGKHATIQEIDVRCFNENSGRYKVIKPQNPSTAENEIEKRWNSSIKYFKDSKDPILYHAGGTEGLNCEVMAEWVMTNISTNRLPGKIAVILGDMGRASRSN